MKLISLVISMLLLAFTSSSQITKANLVANGLTCSMCSKATYKQLSAIPEVEKVETDLNKTAFIIYFKKGAMVSPVALKKKVEAAGFSIGSLELTFQFNNQKADNNNSFTWAGSTYTFIETSTKNLNGEVKVKVLDKGYISDKEFKQMQKLAKNYPGYISLNENTYHIKA